MKILFYIYNKIKTFPILIKNIIAVLWLMVHPYKCAQHKSLFQYKVPIQEDKKYNTLTFFSISSPMKW